MKDNSLNEVESRISKVKSQESVQRKTTIFTFTFIIVSIIFVFAITAISFLKAKNLAEKLYEEGIETVGIIERVYHYENHKAENDTDYWKASFYFLEMETGEYLHTVKVVSMPPKSAKPGSKYRVRYLAGKAIKTATIYFHEPITESAPKSSGN